MILSDFHTGPFLFSILDKAQNIIVYIELNRVKMKAWNQTLHKHSPLMS